MSIHFGLIGCGEIGSLRAEALAKTDSLRLVAVNDLDRERAGVLASRHRAVVERDWQALIERNDLDAVIISTPTALHAAMCIAALQSGKHVLCEKPLATTRGECRMILEAQRENERFLATGFNYRFYPSIRKARALFEAGLIGDLDHIRSYTGYSAADNNRGGLHDCEAMGGGALRDNGIHLIDLTRYFLGEVVEVKGFASNSVWGFKNCEDNGFALLRNPKGNIASLHASWTEWRGYRLRIEIYGNKGCIRASCFPMWTQAFWARQRGGRARRKTHVFPLTQMMEHLRSYRWVVTQSFIHELRAFSMSLRDGRQAALATGLDGLRAVEIAQAASQQSLRGPSEIYDGQSG